MLNYLCLHMYAEKILRYTSENVFVPLTVGGGIRDFTDGNGRLLFFSFCRTMPISNVCRIFCFPTSVIERHLSYRPLS